MTSHTLMINLQTIASAPSVDCVLIKTHIPRRCGDVVRVTCVGSDQSHTNICEDSMGNMGHSGEVMKLSGGFRLVIRYVLHEKNRFFLFHIFCPTFDTKLAMYGFRSKCAMAHFLVGFRSGEAIPSMCLISLPPPPIHCVQGANPATGRAIAGRQTTGVGRALC